MKHEKLLNALLAAILAFALAYAGIGCLVSACNLNADMTLLGWAFALTAILCVALLLLRRSGTILLAGSALILGYFLQNGRLLAELERFAYVISRPWYAAYGWRLLKWADGPESQEVTFALALMGCLTVLAAAWVISRRKNLFFVLLPAILPLSLCFVVTDTVPEVTWLFWFALPLFLLLMTHGVRKRSAVDGLRLTAILLIPVFLASVVLFAALPQSGYERQLSDLQQTVLSWMQGLPFVVQNPGGHLSISPDGTISRTIDLSTVGPRRLPRYTVMDVVSDRFELLYLRGQAMDVYDGSYWTVLTGDIPEDIYWPVNGLVSDGSLSVQIRTSQTVLYFPYYTGGDLWNTQFEQGSLPNPENLRTYTVERLTPGDEPVSWQLQERNSLYNQYLLLPQDTLSWAQLLLARNGIFSLETVDQQVSAISVYVENAAEYDLETQRMPADETDFVRWFLEESDTGYCIHFASAATVLLRAAGIPARFVTGYAQEVEAGVPTPITADRSHAWVEYLHPEQGWKMLDPTPAIGIPPTSESTPPTEETETTAPTETTEPTKITEPTETTAPTETAASTETETTTQPTATVPTDSVNVPVEAPRRPIWQGVWVIGGLFGGILLVLGQYGLRRQLRKRKLHRDGPNRQAVHRWLYVTKLCRHLKLEVPKDLWFLTEKAMFSQHTLTNAELAEYSRFIRQAHQTLQAAPLFKRLWLKLILGLG